MKPPPGKGRAEQASDESSEASSKEFGEEDDDEEGNYEVEEDEEELEEDSESEGEWGRGFLTALGTQGSFELRVSGRASPTLEGRPGGSEVQRAKG